MLIFDKVERLLTGPGSVFLRFVSACLRAADRYFHVTTDGYIEPVVLGRARFQGSDVRRPQRVILNQSTS